MTTNIEQEAREAAERYGYVPEFAVPTDEPYWKFVEGYMAGATRPEPLVTEAEVEAAARAGHEYLRSQRPSDHGPYASWEELDEDYREYLRGIQRAALEAARTTREGKKPWMSE